MELVKFLWQISWRNISIASLAGLISGFSNALIISVINRKVHESGYVNSLFFFATLAIFILITSTIAQFVLIYLSQNAIYELRLKLSKNILSSPLEHLEKLQDNRLIVTLTDDINTLTRAVSSIPSIFIDFATVVGCYVYLAWTSGILSVLAISFTAIAIFFVQTILSKAQRIFMEAREEEDTLFKHFKAIINGTKELKLNRWKREEFLEKKLKVSATKLRQKNSKAMNSFVIANGFGQMLQFTCLGLILFTLPKFIDLPLPILATYVLISTFIALPMQNLLNRIPELVRGNVALQKIERMQLALINLSEIETIPAASEKNCYLNLQQITYRYHPDLPPGNDQNAPPHPPEHFPEDRSKGHPAHPERKRPHPPHRIHPIGHPDRGQFPPPLGQGDQGFLLGPITLAAQTGDLIFIVGSNGSGKSTLAKLIVGLYTPQSGSIYLNGEEITSDNVEWYRQHFSVTFSDVFLFEDCLGSNNPNLDRDIEYYLHELQLSHKVSVKNGVLSTTSLSQGQRKRLALLAAFLEDRPIYLFDEWAADQDPVFREIFYEKILAQLKARNKIVIVITHDDRYFHLANHIIKLEYGKIELEQTI